MTRIKPEFVRLLPLLFFSDISMNSCVAVFNVILPHIRILN